VVKGDTFEGWINPPKSQAVFLLAKFRQKGKKKKLEICQRSDFGLF
jgi:hypothetical protein